MGWRGGCLALELVRGALRHYCLGGCSALVVCVRRWRPVSAGLGTVLGVVSSPFPPARPAFPVLCVAGRPVWVSLILARWYAIPCGLCVPRARSGCPSGFPRVSFVCLCARSLAASATPPPPRAGVARAPRAVPVLGAGRAVPHGPCPSACPASVPCSVWLAWGQGAARSRFPLPGLGLRAPRGVGAGVETRHQPHSARSCKLALRALGAARGCPGGAPLAWVWGVRGRALPPPSTTRRFGRAAGPTTHWLWVRGLRAWGPVTNPTARTLASWLCVLRGRHEGARGGRLLPGRPGLGALPPPTARPFGRAAGAHYPLAVGAGAAGVGTRHEPHSMRSCKLALRAVGAARGRPGGGASCLGVGRPGSGALPPPTARPLGRMAGAHYPLAVVAGGAGVGTRHQPHSARSCELALRTVEAARGCPGGAPLAWVWGVRGRAVSHPRPLVLSGVRPGPLLIGCGCGGCGRGGSSPSPQRALLRAGFACSRGGTGAPGGGASCLGLGVPGVVRSPTPDHSSFRACSRGPLLTGCGCGSCKRGYPSPTPPSALLRAGFAHCWGGTRAPRGGCLLPGCGGSGVGRSPTPDRPSFGAYGRGPLPTGCGCGGCGRGDPSPTSHHML